MARIVTKKKLGKKADTFGGNRGPAKELTLEELREKHELGTKERLVVELNALASHRDVQREALNGYNRQKTKAGKAFVAYTMTNNIEIGKAEVHIGETAYGYDYSTGDTISPEKLYGLFEKKKITKEQFLKSISVTKEAAKRNIGDHILVTITDDKRGKTLDIRTRELDVPAREPTIINSAAKPKPAGKVNRANEQKPGANVRGGVQRIRRQRIIR